MKILAIETSCDETALALIEAQGTDADASFTVLGNALYSQIDIHKEYGGVFPALAKRAHAKNLTPLLHAALKEAQMLKEGSYPLSQEAERTIPELLSREPDMTDAFLSFITKTMRPDIDAIAVTHGPGLEPALWVGVNFARALSLAWDIPVVPINHMEGHFLAALGTHTQERIEIRDVKLPVLGLLISGGHTELDLMRSWLSYECLGATRDDAVGEAFDKVARMIGLPYPGGPEVSRLAEAARNASLPTGAFTLPRPMLKSEEYDFSFSGIKTAVLYACKAKGTLLEEEKQALAREFEDAVTEVLFEKTSRALTNTGAKTLIIGGGVSANAHIQRVFTHAMRELHPDVTLRIPTRDLTTDNAVMIGIAGFYRALRQAWDGEVRAHGNLHLAQRGI